MQDKTDIPQQIKQILDDIINEMSQHPQDFAKNPNKDFTRDRKLSFNKLLHLLLGMRGNSISKELYDYFKNDDLMTSSAFVQQRDKLLPNAMTYLLKEFNNRCNDSKTYNGYNLLAIDGSKLNIAYNPNDKDTYIKQGNLKGFNQLELHALFDLMNKIYIDATVEPIHTTSELNEAVTIIDTFNFKEKSILVADRGYGSLNFIQHIKNQPNLDFVIRAKQKNWIKEIENLPMKELDTEVSFTIINDQTNASKKLYQKYKGTGKIKNLSTKKWDFESPFEMTLRIVRFKISEDTYETLVTSLNRFEFPIEKLKEIYHLRWGIETSFRELKYAIGLVNFHAKKVEYIKQEAFARLIMYNFCERITNSVVIKQDANRKWTYQVNFTMGIHICVDFFKHHSNEPPPNIENLISNYILPIRPDRQDERKLKAKTAVFFLYRVA